MLQNAETLLDHTSVVDRKACICAGFFCRPQTVDKKPANVQVIPDRKPAIGPTKENKCAFAGILFNRADFGRNRCKSAGFAAKARCGDDRGRRGLSERPRMSRLEAFRANEAADIRQRTFQTWRYLFPAHPAIPR
ncbi:hypothetical protein [Cohnella rhizosphaerae]|uniref:hypothetical protein n=1 Tax=Cohnella rhizosphaerae TaxID=1457232 RepID=UPI0024069BA3|nr:hypothetical protein [Cohnella rhizosphaerae]